MLIQLFNTPRGFFHAVLFKNHPVESQTFDVSLPLSSGGYKPMLVDVFWVPLDYHGFLDLYIQLHSYKLI